MQSTFKTHRLTIRPRSLADLENCLSMDRDGEVTKYIPGPWQDPIKHRAFVLDKMTAAYPQGLGYWSIFENNKPDTFVGWVLLLPYAYFDDEIEIGWRLKRNHWGKGYATEASKTILSHALEIELHKKIVADIHPENTASIGVAQKIGLKYREDRSLHGLILKSFQMGNT